MIELIIVGIVIFFLMMVYLTTPPEIEESIINFVTKDGNNTKRR